MGIIGIQNNPSRRLTICENIRFLDNKNIDVPRMIMHCYLDLAQVSHAKEILDEFESNHGDIFR